MKYIPLESNLTSDTIFRCERLMHAMENNENNEKHCAEWLLHIYIANTHKTKLSSPNVCATQLNTQQNNQR